MGPTAGSARLHGRWPSMRRRSFRDARGDGVMDHARARTPFDVPRARLTLSTMSFGFHLTFRGNCREAFERYATIFGAEIKLMLAYADTPTADGVPPEWRTKIAHATLHVSGSELAGADVEPHLYEPPRG